LRIAVIDGQGGTIGAGIVRKIKQNFGEEVELWALGTNAVATSQMMKAGANRGATGEAAVRWSVDRVDVILGSISILVSDAFLGEMTPEMARAVGSSKALKLVLPLTLEAVKVVNTIEEPLPHMIDTLVKIHLTPLVFQRKSHPAPARTG